MSQQRERAVNDDLQALADAYRLGQIPREEYRARRRRVLEGYAERAVAAAATPAPAPRSRDLTPVLQRLVDLGSSTSPSPSSPASAPLPPWIFVLLFVAALALSVVAIVMLVG